MSGYSLRFFVFFSLCAKGMKSFALTHSFFYPYQVKTLNFILVTGNINLLYMFVLPLSIKIFERFQKKKRMMSGTNNEYDEYDEKNERERLRRFKQTSPRQSCWK